MKKISTLTALFTLFAASVSAAELLPVQTGALTATIDAVRVTDSAIRAHTQRGLNASRADGGSLWLDTSSVNSHGATTFETGGYRSRLSQIDLGADIKYGNTFFGVVYTYGRGYVAPKAAQVTGTRHTTDHYGLKIFAAHNFGELSVHGSLGYAYQHTQLTGNNAKYHDLIASVGVSADHQAGPVTITPYVSVTAHHILANDPGAITQNNLTLAQIPLGVRLATQFEVSGFTVEPVLDSSFIAQTGDRHLEGSGPQGAYRLRYTPSHLIRNELGLTISGAQGEVGLKASMEHGSNHYRSYGATLHGKYTF